MSLVNEYFWFVCLLQRDYEEFKVKINALVATAQKVPEEGWTMQDGTPWPGNNVRDHPGMIQVIIILLMIQAWKLCFSNMSLDQSLSFDFFVSNAGSMTTSEDFLRIHSFLNHFYFSL